MKLVFSKQITFSDVEAYAKLTGDYNPIHFDADYAAQTPFGKPIVHGPLVLTFVTTLFAKEYPGPGTVYLSHEVKYLKPVLVGDTINATLELIEETSKGHLIVRTTCSNQGGDIVLDGIARLKKF